MKPQLFRPTEYNERFDDWTGKNKDFQAAEFIKMFDELPISKTFGFFIWDSNLSDLSEFFSRDYFAENWTAIIGALGVAGTYESYLTIIKSALGQQTDVFFESPNPSHLIINISNPTGEFNLGAYTDNQLKDLGPDQQNYPDQSLGALNTLAPLTVSQTEKLLQLLEVNGVFVEINFI